MGRRQDDTAVLDPPLDDWATRWLCQCGYSNAGRGRCLQCGRPAPPEAQAKGGLWIGEDAPAPRQAEKAGGKAGRTVAAIIGLNLAMQIVLAIVVVAGDLALSSAVRVSLYTGLVFYIVVALWVMARSATLGIRPEVGRSSALTGAAEGLVVGGGLAVLLVAGLRLALGHAVLDPTSAVLAAGGSVGALVVGVVLIALLGPLVEELVFRGFLAEAFRHRGRSSAILISAAAFSLAHLRLAQFKYYLAMGVVFGLVYWRRGLIGSICAHGAFNGMLIVVAVAAMHGPAITAHAAGSTVVLPAAWQTRTDVAGDDLVAYSPLGTTVELGHVDGAVPDVTLLARALSRGALPVPPGIEPDYTTVAVINLPAGPAVSMAATIAGHSGRVVFIPRGSRMWIATMRAGGGHGAGDDFESIIRSWQLPF